MTILALPVMYEDDGQEEMGESNYHTLSVHTTFYGMSYCLMRKKQYAIFSNLDTYYHPVDSRAYFSPDVMVVEPAEPLPYCVESYRFGVDGPAPVLVIEVLSQRSIQQQDLTAKSVIYARLGVSEYILLDNVGTFLPARLTLKRLQPDGSWIDNRDADGGVTSRLGFRIILEADGLPRVIEKRTGRRFVRPWEQPPTIEAAKDRIRELEAEIARLRREIAAEKGS